ncbi:MAG: aminoglycoside 3'-phosphotransferase [Clostridia bacterium]|nr:aminoglycoside 3'-phosphotransferase [Clostridia bacterium]
MKRTQIERIPLTLPRELERFTHGAKIYDSSSSPQARVYFIDKDGGYYLKTAEKGALRNEAELTRYFHEKGLSANVLAYISAERDFMLTERVRGEDLTFAKYLAEPKKLCDISAALLRELHETEFSACPVPNHTAKYLATVERNYRTGICDLSFAPEFTTAEEAYSLVRENAHMLKNEVLLHGDYCLPNVMLDDWRFSGFIDVGNGGVGDRHVDLFWGAWTLNFNLKTDEYRVRFFDAYGRDKIDEEKIRIIAAAEVFG